jgi:cobyrinic acid a,c-diamide synthase
VLGAIRRCAALAVPERYLGLVPPAEQDAVDRFLDAAATLVGEAVDLARLLSLAEQPEPARETAAFAALLPSSHAATGAVPGSSAGPRARLAVARDRAFGFYYADALDLLGAAGLELCPFSPLEDPALPSDTHGLYLGGGFPELFAAELAANRPLLAAIRAAAARGMPIYAECGGLMYLAERLVDRTGRGHALAGVVPATVTMTDARLHLGYRTARALRDTLLVPAGAEVRGHEFHYSDVRYAPAAPHAYRLAETACHEGYAHGNVLASYLHLHLASAPVLVERFAAACARWRAQRTAAGSAS